MRRNPTIHDVAGVLGMHKSTVSLALSGKGNVSAATRERVLAVARELGYAPNPLAQRLARGHRNDLVCLFCGALDLGMATEKIVRIQKKLNAASLEAPIYSCADAELPQEASVGSQADQIRQLCRQRPRAIILATYMLDDIVLSELEEYRREGGTVVSYDTTVPLECDQVVFDREDNAYRAARHLLERGHRRIGVGMSRMPDKGAGATSDPQPYRMRGFRRAFDEFGVTLREEWSFRCDLYEEGGAEMARQFLALRERPTALCIVNDYVAMAFMVEVMRAGVRVPEDLSIISHDNRAVARFCPVPLTSMTHPSEQIAQAVADLLLARIRGPLIDAPRRTVTIHGELAERESVRDEAEEIP